MNSTYDYYVPLSKHVELPSGVDEFAFRFAAMNYQLQHRVHYQYILEGYEQEWHNAEKDLTARYSNLPAGNYTFRVKAFLLESPEKYDQRSIEVVVPGFFLFSEIAFLRTGSKSPLIGTSLTPASVLVPSFRNGRYPIPRLTVLHT